jgi:hypothetical protein
LGGDIALTASGVDTLSKRIPDVGPVPGWIAEASAVALLFVAGGTAIYINDSDADGKLTYGQSEWRWDIHNVNSRIGLDL